MFLSIYDVDKPLNAFFFICYLSILSILLKFKRRLVLMFDFILFQYINYMYDMKYLSKHDIVQLHFQALITREYN